LAWLEFPQLIAYFAGVLGCAILTRRLMMGRFSDEQTRQVGWAFCPGALFGGMALASLTTPDWNPIALLWLFLPFYAFSAWALFFSLLVRRGSAPWPAGRRALLWTVPSLLLAPLVIAIGLVWMAS
jgi:hypothetical protein